MNTQQTAEAETTPRHPFHRRGLGAPPYRFIGQTENVFRPHPGAPGKPGGSCDYCHTGIMDEYWFLSSDKKKFRVGCDCLRKASKESDDYPLQSLTARLVRENARKARHAREKAKLLELDALLVEHEEALATFPHPVAYRANQGGNLFHYATWMRKNAGATGGLLALKRCKEALAKPQEQKEGIE